MIRFLEFISSILGIASNIKSTVEIAEDLKDKPRKFKRIIAAIILIVITVGIVYAIFHHIDNSVAKGMIYSPHDWRMLKSEAEDVAIGTKHYVNIGDNSEAIYCVKLNDSGQISLDVNCITENRDESEFKHWYEDGWRVLLFEEDQEIKADSYISNDVPIPSGKISMDAGTYYILFQLIDESKRYDDAVWFEVKFSKRGN